MQVPSAGGDVPSDSDKMPIWMSLTNSPTKSTLAISKKKRCYKRKQTPTKKKQHRNDIKSTQDFFWSVDSSCKSPAFAIFVSPRKSTSKARLFFRRAVSCAAGVGVVGGQQT